MRKNNLKKNVCVFTSRVCVYTKRRFAMFLFEIESFQDVGCCIFNVFSF